MNFNLKNFYKYISYVRLSKWNLVFFFEQQQQQKRTAFSRNSVYSYIIVKNSEWKSYAFQNIIFYAISMWMKCVHVYGFGKCLIMYSIEWKCYEWLVKYIFYKKKNIVSIRIFNEPFSHQSMSCFSVSRAHIMWKIISSPSCMQGREYTLDIHGKLNIVCSESKDFRSIGFYYVWFRLIENTELFDSNFYTHRILSSIT